MQQESSEDSSSFDQDQVETAKEIVSRILSELQRELQPKIEPTILITEAEDSEIPENPEEIQEKIQDNTIQDSIQSPIPIPELTISADEEVSNESNSRPASLVAVVRPMQASSQAKIGDDEVFTLSNLPSPNDIQRSGSIVGEPQLPVPTEFRDMQEDDEEARKVNILLCIFLMAFSDIQMMSRLNGTFPIFSIRNIFTRKFVVKI